MVFSFLYFSSFPSWSEKKRWKEKTLWIGTEARNNEERHEGRREGDMQVFLTERGQKSERVCWEDRRRMNGSAGGAEGRHEWMSDCSVRVLERNVAWRRGWEWQFLCMPANVWRLFLVRRTKTKLNPPPRCNLLTPSYWNFKGRGGEERSYKSTSRCIFIKQPNQKYNGWGLQKGVIARLLLGAYSSSNPIKTLKGGC